MEIKGKVYCFFEQSGTFKNEFIKLGIPAEDYDIQNNFGQTDHVVNLFGEIEKCYAGGESLFDDITKDDLIIAFFPCIFFCEANARLFRFEDMTNRTHTHERAVADILKRSQNRQYFFELALKMFAVCDIKGLRLIVENPYSKIHFLQQYFPYRPKLIDKDRSLRGDKFKKPTQYWFVNCDPTNGFSYQKVKPIAVNSFQSVNHNDENYKKLSDKNIFLCTEEKSMMTTDYARNFICDFILGKEQNLDNDALF